MAGKILVTSAAGNIGGEIVRLLKEKCRLCRWQGSKSVEGVDSVSPNFFMHNCINFHDHAVHGEKWLKIPAHSGTYEDEFRKTVDGWRIRGTMNSFHLLTIYDRTAKR